MHDNSSCKNGFYEMLKKRITSTSAPVEFLFLPVKSHIVSGGGLVLNWFCPKDQANRW